MILHAQESYLSLIISSLNLCSDFLSSVGGGQHSHTRVIVDRIVQ